MSTKDLTPDQLNQLPSAKLSLRFAAMLYDALLVFALWMVVGACFVALNDGEAVRGAVFESTRFMATFIFFTSFWLKGGQTLGMRAWKLKAISESGLPMNLWQCTFRFFAAILSLVFFWGYFWLLYSDKKQTMHEQFSQTKTVRLP